MAINTKTHFATQNVRHAEVRAQLTQQIFWSEFFVKMNTVYFRNSTDFNYNFVRYWLVWPRNVFVIYRRNYV